MMTTLATLDGHRCTRARVQLPAWGVWYAEATLDTVVALAGQVTMQLADLALVGTIVAGATFGGSTSYRLAGGAGGWGRQLAARGYATDAGVKLATVLGDAAQSAGETLDLGTVPATTVGPCWTREAGPAGRSLELLSRESWYVGADGVTRLGRRAPVEYVGLASRLDQDLVRGSSTLGTEEIATILPGTIVDGVEAVDVLHELGARGLRTTIWGRGVGTTSRRLVALRRLVAQVIPDYRYRGVYEYRVVSQSGERLTVQPVRVSLGLPDMLLVRVRPGVAGCRADVALGSTVLLSFVDADPGRPVIVAFEDADGAGFAPSRLDLVGTDDVVPGALAGGRALRYGDSIMMPVGPGDVMTSVPIIANPAAPSSLSRVFP